LQSGVLCPTMDQYVPGLKKLVTLPGSQLPRTTPIIDGVVNWLVDLNQFNLRISSQLG